MLFRSPRADEGGHLNHGKPGHAQTVDQLDLVGGGDPGVLVLKAVSRPHFHDRDVSTPESADVHLRQLDENGLRLHQIAIAAVHGADGPVGGRAKR